jgi:hypothetical protein
MISMAAASKLSIKYETPRKLNPVNKVDAFPNVTFPKITDDDVSMSSFMNLYIKLKHII